MIRGKNLTKKIRCVAEKRYLIFKYWIVKNRAGINGDLAAVGHINP